MKKLKFLLNIRWIVVLIAINHICNANADVNDLSIQTNNPKDIVIVTTDSIQSISTFHATFENAVREYSFFFAVIASGLAAIIVLFLFFLLFRPRLEVMPIVAFQDGKDEKENVPVQECMIVIKNKCLIHCNDIRVEISKHFLSKYDEETREIISHPKFLTISSRLRSEKVSTISIPFTIKPIKDGEGHLLMPKRIIVEILAQHALSGIISPTRKIFTLNDFMAGKYINSTFVKQGDTYQQAIIKENIKKIKCVILLLSIIWWIVTIAMIFSSSSVFVKVLIPLFCLILFMILVVLWQLNIITKSQMYSNNIAHIIKNTIIELHQHKHVNKDAAKGDSNVEDVVPEEIQTIENN